jgi:hypothetical protein
MYALANTKLLKHYRRTGEDIYFMTLTGCSQGEEAGIPIPQSVSKAVNVIEAM